MTSEDPNPLEVEKDMDHSVRTLFMKPVQAVIRDLCVCACACACVCVCVCVSVALDKTEQVSTVTD